jgi:acyl-CoA hydrolase
MPTTLREIKNFQTFRLVKSEDLNHHGTLFAGRSAEWFVESGFIAAANIVNPKNVICVQIHGMYFSKPVRPGQIVCYTSKIVYTGNSSLYAYIKVTVDGDDQQIQVDGFITFVHVDANTKAIPHNIEMVPKTDEDNKLIEKAMKLKKKLKDD